MTIITTEQPSELQRLIAAFDRALTALGVSVGHAALEAWGVLVHECMSGHGRTFHDVQHVLYLAEVRPEEPAPPPGLFPADGADFDPILILAALFHDTVYYQVDGGFPDGVASMLEDAIITLSDGQIAFAPITGDPDRALVAAVFGIVPGEPLTPYTGLNELLSAMLAARTLGDTLSRAHMAEIVVAIETTIPFRGPNAAGASATDRLLARLVAARDLHGLDEPACVAAVQRAVTLANRDICNFAYADPARFLVKTWELLPESNYSLRGPPIYTVAEYRGAIARMERFFAHVDPSLVFTAFGGQPTADDFAAMTERARRNIDIGGRYLRTKLVAARMVQTVADLTGGDAPMCLFLGDLPHGGRVSNTIAEYLPDRLATTVPGADSRVLALLAEGRAADSDFDLVNAPLAALLYQALGDAGVQRALDTWPGSGSDDAGRGERVAWLVSLPAAVTGPLLDGAAQLAVTRVEAIVALSAAMEAARGS